MHALVTDAHLRNAVAGIRGLGRAGIPVVALAAGRARAGCRSRFAAERGEGPDAVSDPAGFSAAVVRLARRHGPVVLYPSQEPSLDAVDGLWSGVPELRMPYASRESVAQLRDKTKLPSLAAATGVATPEVHYDGPAGGLPPAALPYPCLVKPLKPTQVLGYPRVLRSAADAGRLRAELPESEPVLVQELADGELRAAVLLVARDGSTVAAFEQRTLRTWPPGAGPSAAAVSVAPDAELIEGSRRVLDAAGYWGLAELQYVELARGPALIDVNTRFYGSMPLAMRSGVNFPALWHAVATGATPEPPPPYATGVGFRRLEVDLSAAARGNPKLLGRRAPRPTAGAMWAADDPLASALLAGAAVASRVRSRLRTRP
jgi:predicted ATP-grasp superfamily ATP-dependent carboligase